MNDKTTNSPPSKVSEACVKAWAAIHTIGHDGKNPHLKNKYTTYDKIMQVIRPILAEHDLAVMQLPVVIDNRAAVQTILRHTDGGVLDLGTIAVPCKKDSDPQAYGSSMTYAKRYSLCAAFGIPTGDDDDGNLGAATPTQAPARAEPTTKQLAIKAIQDWCGMKDDALIEAMGMVVKLAGSKDHQALIDYVNAHKGEDFIKHTQNGVAINA